MSTPHEKLADSLRVLQQAQADGRTVFQSTAFSRTHRERLVSNGFLREVVKGWYMLSNPSEKNGESTGWYASFFTFVAAYCNERFGSDWHLSPEASLAVYAGSTAIPSQVLVYAKAGKNNKLPLLYGTSIFDYKTPVMPAPSDIAVVNGLRLLTLPLALVKATPTLFVEKALDMQVAHGNRLRKRRRPTEKVVHSQWDMTKGCKPLRNDVHSRYFSRGEDDLAGGVWIGGGSPQGAGMSARPEGNDRDGDLRRAVWCGWMERHRGLV
jgi:hypothetical protein